MIKLFAPKEYWKLTPEAKAEIVSGCGPGDIGDYFVPDSIWGVSVKPCCNIHDYMYYVGETEEDRETADRVFLNNMVRAIVANSKSRWLLKLRMRTVKVYYNAVREFGGPAFWDNKNQEAEYQEVDVTEFKPERNLLKRKLDV
jgi:hypothetical protein